MSFLPNRASLFAGVVAVAAWVSPALAQSDEFVNQVNGLFKAVPAARRGDLLLLPALAKTTPAPRGVATASDAWLLPATAPGFADAAAWAKAEPQAAVLKVLSTITKEGDWSKSYAFAQAYGADVVEPAMVRDRLYTELGDPPTLAAAQHLYMGHLDRLASLVQIEATRRAGEGDPAGALDVLTDFVFFGRQMIDRPFTAEANWGMNAMSQGLERLRDIAYVDMLGKRAIGTDRLRGVLQRLAANGFTDLTRRTFPMGDRAGSEQIVSRVYHGGSTVDEKVFAPTMARLGASGEPLRLFSEASRWRTAAAVQRNADIARERVRGIYDDWAARWAADWFDRRQDLQPEFEKLDAATLAAVSQSTPNMMALLEARQIVRTELVGTRASLSLVGYAYTQKQFATQYSAIRPLWMTSLEMDPFNPNRVDGPMAWMTYMVPMRDTPKGSNGERVPYEVAVVTHDPSYPVNRRLTDDTFLLVSMGANYQADFGKNTQNIAKKFDKPADYLIFPPVVSLQREVMSASGAFK